MKAIEKRRTLGQSPAIAAAALKRRIGKPLVLELAPKFSREITVKQLDDLRIDETYQRLKVTNWVLTLTQALLAGGKIPAPATLAMRADGHYYIVDGQQRYWACVEAKVPLPCVIYDLRGRSKEDAVAFERKLFTILNSTRADTANHIVKAWPGALGQMLRDADSDQDSILFGKINFGNNRARPFGASTLVRTLVILLGRTGVTKAGSGGTHATLAAAEELYKQPQAKERVRVFLGVLAEVFGDQHETGAPHYVLKAFAKVAQEVWNGDGPSMPSQRSISAFRRINWHTYVPSGHAKYVPVILDAIKERWKK